jgi:hypothetical protein
MTDMKQAYLYSYMGDGIRPPDWWPDPVQEGHAFSYSTASMACGKLPTKDTNDIMIMLVF